MARPWSGVCHPFRPSCVQAPSDVPGCWALARSHHPSFGRLRLSCQLGNSRSCCSKRAQSQLQYAMDITFPIPSSMLRARFSERLPQSPEPKATSSDSCSLTASLSVRSFPDESPHDLQLARAAALYMTPLLPIPDCEVHWRNADRMKIKMLRSIALRKTFRCKGNIPEQRCAPTAPPAQFASLRLALSCGCQLGVLGALRQVSQLLRLYAGQCREQGLGFRTS